MAQEQSGSTSAAAGKTLRPALIASENTVCEYSIFLQHLLAGLADESIPAALVCPQDYDMDSIVPPAVEVIRHPALKLPLLGHYNRNILIEKLRSFEPTLLHCFDISDSALVKKLSRQLNLPYVLTVTSLQKCYRHFSISSKRCAKIIVPAKSIADNIASAFPRLADRIEQINIGTFTAEAVSCFCNTSQLVGILVAHKLQHTSELENFLGAVRHLIIDGYEFMLVIIGSSQAERQLRSILEVLGLSLNTIIVPRLQPWRSTFSAGDIFVQPVAADSFNPLLLEAMSIGSAVAACKGGVDDLIIEDRTAVVFDPDDELSIYNSLQKLLDKHEFARKLAGEAQQLLRENYSVSKMIEQTIQTYRNAQERPEN